MFENKFGQKHHLFFDFFLVADKKKKAIYCINLKIFQSATYVP